MKRLDRLPQMAQRQLGGLTATSVILAKAKLEAAEMRKPKTAAARLRPVLAACVALVICVGAVYALRPDQTGDLTLDSPVIDTHSAGIGAAPTQKPSTLADVPSGVISMSAGARRSSDTLFADLGSATFPLITLDGATYRMLLRPSAIDPAMLGEAMGAVSEFNVEPALGMSGVVSNAVTLGETVYAVDGMGGTLVAAKVDGMLRVFQRVSYAGSALIGTETLADTLCAAQDVRWIEVGGMGRVDDPATAAELMETLLTYADYQGTSLSGSGSMQIGLANGLVLQLLVGEDTVSACGTWSCPDFFEAFQKNAK